MQCDQIRRQKRGYLNIEHIVVSDGPDPEARGIAEHFGCKYIEHAENKGCAGAFGRDTGIAAAEGEYCCFADDENALEHDALETLYGAAIGYDMGIVQCIHRGFNEWRKIPDSDWDMKEIVVHNVDVMCACIRTEIAKQFSFAEEPVYDHDHRTFARIQRAGYSVNFVPVVIGIHL
jgi:glycosyltransferase involved in cell wall biosynthesis